MNHARSPPVRSESRDSKEERKLNMKRTLTIMLLLWSLILVTPALAAERLEVCYPSSVTQSEDKTEIRKVYDLTPEQDPAGISRSDFEQEGWRYTLLDLLRQELPEQEETVTVSSKSKDMSAVLELLPQEKDFVTEDGLEGTLTLRLDSVRVEPAGYGSTTKEISAVRTYTNLSGQDMQYIPKSIEENGKALTLQTVNWQEENSTDVDGYALGEHFSAIATYTGTATSSYVKSYTVTADYAGTVSRVALERIRYVAVFEGTPIQAENPVLESSVEDEAEETTGTNQQNISFGFSWTYALFPLGVLMGIGSVHFFRQPKRSSQEEKTR